MPTDTSLIFVIYIPQLKDMAEIFPQGLYKNDAVRSLDLINGVGLRSGPYSNLNGDHQPRFNPNNSVVPLSSTPSELIANGNPSQIPVVMDIHEFNKLNSNLHDCKLVISNEIDGFSTGQRDSNAERSSSSSKADVDNKEIEQPQNVEKVYKSRSPISSNNHADAEWIEQYEPGVYITLIALRDGTRDLKRVRFRYV